MHTFKKEPAFHGVHLLFHSIVHMMKAAFVHYEHVYLHIPSPHTGLYFVSVSVCDELHPCEGLGRYATFKNFGMAFLLLFRVSTGDNWNGIMKVRHSQLTVLNFNDARSFVLNALDLFWVRLLATYSAFIFTHRRTRSETAARTPASATTQWCPPFILCPLS